MDISEISAFGHVLFFILGGMLFLASGLLVSWGLGRLRQDKPQDQVAYECGEEPLGTAWVRFNMRFYTMGLIFLVFDVELLMLFPWSVVFAEPIMVARASQWGWFTLIEAGIFLLILTLGLVYIWVKGDINWARPQPHIPPPRTKIPPEVYKNFTAGQS